MPMTSRKKNIIYEKTGGRCEYCGRELAFEEMVITRRIPISRGGTNATGNLVPTCLDCNRKKGSLTHRELGNKRREARESHERKVKNLTRKLKILDKTGGLCAYCGTKLTPESMTVDHIVSLSRGGKNSLDNLVAACRDCNHLKASLTLAEFNAIRRIRRRAAGGGLGGFFRRAVSAFRRLFGLGR